MIIGIDLGSTAFKAEVFDEHLKSCGQGASPAAYSPIREGHVEMPLAETETAFRQAVGEAMAAAGAGPGDLRGVAITSQAQTFTVRDASGRARGPFISWRDARCRERNPAAAALPDFAEHAGVGRCGPLLTISKLAWLRDVGRPLAPEDRVEWLPTWFVRELTGHSVVDRNMAAMSGLYSLRDGDWWPEALAACGVERTQLPALAPFGAVVGHTAASAARFGFPDGVPVVLAGNDQTAGAVGAGIDESQAVLITLGTAQVAYVCHDRLPTPVTGTLRGPYPGGRFYRMVADECGTGTVDWASDALGLTGPAAFHQAAGHADVDCPGVRFIADGPAGRGHWVGPDDAGVAERARAVLACLAIRLADMLALLEIDLADWPLLLAGGGRHSTPWRECIARRLDVPLTVIETASPTRGAAKMALAPYSR